MNKGELAKLGVPEACLDAGLEFCSRAAKAGLFAGANPQDLVKDVMDQPDLYLDDELRQSLAHAIIEEGKRRKNAGQAPFKVWGEDQIDLGAIDQLKTACELPVATRGALMPDAHVGYGLPIGGVLATLGAVVPYAVGVDIGCRMKLSIFDLDADELDQKQDRFVKALHSETKFGAGNEWKNPRKHDVMDRDWSITPVTKELKDRAWRQLGTSGGGNHFVEFGSLEILPGQLDPEARQLLALQPNRKYIAVLSHSGSRGPGALVCQHYSKLARERLPKGYEWARHLGWLDLNTEEGQEYWDAMNLMGDFAKANHDVIHRQIAEHLGEKPLLQVENHHNFAWKETHNGQEVIVHRKGATPAAKGVLGVIPGSMADPAYVVIGKGSEESLNSAAHGAGRKLARTKAKQMFQWDTWRKYLKERNVKLMSAGLDEVPGAYKNIEEVMQRQSDLVQPLARFNPRIVRMADDGSVED